MLLSLCLGVFSAEVAIWRWKKKYRKITLNNLVTMDDSLCLCHQEWGLCAHEGWPCLREELPWGVEDVISSDQTRLSAWWRWMFTVQSTMGSKAHGRCAPGEKSTHGLQFFILGNKINLSFNFNFPPAFWSLTLQVTICTEKWKETMSRSHVVVSSRFLLKENMT